MKIILSILLLTACSIKEESATGKLIQVKYHAPPSPYCGALELCIETTFNRVSCYDGIYTKELYERSQSVIGKKVIVTSKGRSTTCLIELNIQESK